MIVYYHPSPSGPPSFLSGARELCARPGMRGGMFVGIGPVYLCGFDEENQGVEVGDGWKAHVVGAVDPFDFRRDIAGQPVVGIRDAEGRIWSVPIILAVDGTRAFPVRYGRDWKPILSEQQKVLVEYAKEARAILPLLVDGTNEQREELLPVACQYAAAAIEYGNHIVSAVLSELNLLDTPLVIGALTAMSNYVEDESGDA